MRRIEFIAPLCYTWGRYGGFGGETMPLTRQTPLTELPGVGPARAKKLEKLGFY